METKLQLQKAEQIQLHVFKEVKPFDIGHELYFVLICSSLAGIYIYIYLFIKYIYNLISSEERKWSLNIFCKDYLELTA